MRCDATYVAVGEESTGKVHVYHRRDIAAKAKTQVLSSVTNTIYVVSLFEYTFGKLVDLQQMAPGIHGAPSNSQSADGGMIEPHFSINAHVQTITAIALNKDILLTGSLDGKLKVNYIYLILVLSWGVASIRCGA